MKKKVEIMPLMAEKESLEKRLESLVFGSVEIRESAGKKYIYVHSRIEGVALTKYVGEYSDELYNLILNNTAEAKAIKKSIKNIQKQLAESGYVDSELSKEVATNIDFARRRLAETIYNQAVLEGIATTYADTETIIEGGKVNNMTASDVLKVVNLKHAWEFILNKNIITSKSSFDLICEINRLIEEGFYYSAGKLRSTPVSIGGTTWKPSLPVESVVKEELHEILASKTSDVDKAIELLLYTMKKQIFIDGNKRTAVIFANHYLISHAKGLIIIPDTKVEEYKRLLIGYYEKNDDKAIKKFIKEFCFVKI